MFHWCPQAIYSHFLVYITLRYRASIEVGGEYVREACNEWESLECCNSKNQLKLSLLVFPYEIIDIKLDIAMNKQECLRQEERF